MEENKVKSYDEIFEDAQKIFKEKTQDYGTSWRFYRTRSMIDKVFIKAYRVRTLQETKLQLVAGKGNNIADEFLGILNYSIFGLIQLKNPGEASISIDRLEALYAEHKTNITDLMKKKNHDYGEGWRHMSISSITDEIIVKLARMITIQKNNGTIVSEGIESCYQDIANYAIFALIHISAGVNPLE